MVTVGRIRRFSAAGSAVQRQATPGRATPTPAVAAPSVVGGRVLVPNEGMFEWMVTTGAVPLAPPDCTIIASFSVLPASASQRPRRISFVQTVIARTQGMFQHPEVAATRDAATGIAVDALPGETEPFAGAGHRARSSHGAARAGLEGEVMDPRSHAAESVAGGRPGTAGSDSTFRDGPFAGSQVVPAVVRRFELAVVEVDSGRTLCSVRWGYDRNGADPVGLVGGARADVVAGGTPELEAARLRFYHGTFDHWLDDFGRGAHELSAAHRAILQQLSRLRALRRIVLVGACDNSGEPEIASLERARAAEHYLRTVLHVPASVEIVVEGHGVEARFPNPPGQEEPRNRRVGVQVAHGDVEPNQVMVNAGTADFRHEAARRRDQHLLYMDVHYRIEGLLTEADPAQLLVLWEELEPMLAVLDGNTSPTVANPRSQYRGQLLIIESRVRAARARARR
jgi:hypothetical protein